MAPSPSTQRVAVIAVHGVGSPPPNETARDLAKLLVRSAPDGARYERFAETRIMVPTAPLDVGRSARRSGWVKLTSAFTSDAADRTKLGLGDEEIGRAHV